MTGSPEKELAEGDVKRDKIATIPDSWAVGTCFLYCFDCRQYSERRKDKEAERRKDKEEIFKRYTTRRGFAEGRHRRRSGVKKSGEKCLAGGTHAVPGG